MNPYEPAPLPSDSDSPIAPYMRPPAATLIAVVCIACAIVTIGAVGFDSARSFMRARFGDEFPVTVLLPAAALAVWLRKPTIANMVYSAIACFLVAANHYFTLAAYTFIWETVDSVSNPRHDRLHSSFWWSVVPFLVAGCVLLLTSVRLARARSEYLRRLKE